MGLIKFLFITILVMWLIKQIIRLILPMLFQKVVNKAQENVNNQYSRHNHYQQKNPVGKITVD